MVFGGIEISWMTYKVTLNIRLPPYTAFHPSAKGSQFFLESVERDGGGKSGLKILIQNFKDLKLHTQ